MTEYKNREVAREKLWYKVEGVIDTKDGLCGLASIEGHDLDEIKGIMESLNPENYTVYVQEPGSYSREEDCHCGKCNEG